MIRARLIAVLLLAIAIVSETTAMGVARAHETSRTYSSVSGCHAAANDAERSGAPSSGAHRDCLLCLQCAADAPFDELLPLHRNPFAHRFGAKRFVSWALQISGAAPALERSQLPRAPPRA